MTWGLPPDVLQAFPTVDLVISHQKGTKFCYNRLKPEKIPLCSREEQ